MRTTLGRLALVAAVALPGCGAQPQDPSRLAAEAVLTVDGMEPRACGGAADMSALTAEPGAERADDPAAAALREITRTGIAGMSFPPAHGWVVLSSSEDEVMFGHREGDVGIGHVVTVARRGSEWGFSGSGGCGPLGYRDGRRATHIPTYVERPGELVLNWTSGTCDDGSAPHVAVSETDEVVSVLLVPPPDSRGSCDGAGTSESTPVELEAPVGSRRVENVGYLPVREVPSEEQDAADQQAEAEAYAAAERMCADAATSFGQRPGVVYPTDVGTVRTHVEEAAKSWAGLPAGGSAGHCYLEHTDGSTWAYVAATGASPIVYDRAYDRGGTYFRLGD